jgi:hypothetical protein
LPAAAKLESVSAEWQQHCNDDKAAWAAEQQRTEQEAVAKVADAKAAGAAVEQDVKQHYKRKLAALEERAAAMATAADRQGSPLIAHCKLRGPNLCLLPTTPTRILSLSPNRCREWHQRLGTAVAKAEADMRAALDSCRAASAQREQQLAAQLAAAQEFMAASLAQQDKLWSEKMAAAEEQHLRVRPAAS